MPQKYYKGDPYWTRARFPSVCCRCGRQIKTGEEIFYYPKGKAVYCNAPACGISESASFEAVAEDEYFYNGGR